MVKQMARALSRSTELYSWSAMNWANHWQQRVGVELARGRARVIGGARRGLGHGRWTGRRWSGG